VREKLAEIGNQSLSLHWRCDSNAWFDKRQWRFNIMTFI